MTFLRILVGLLIVVPLSAASADGQIEIDASKGVIEGTVAVALWPGSEYPEGEIRAIDPAGFQGRLVPQDNPDQELSYPCGAWFQPPPDKYRFWLEGNGMISPFSSIMIYGGGRFHGNGLASITAVVPAGIVRLCPELEPPADVALRLLHLDSHSRGPFLKREMSRRVHGHAAEQGVLMPTGRVIAVLFDNASQQYAAISRPEEVFAGEPSYVCPKPPEEGTDLLVILTRQTDVRKTDDDDVQLMITGLEKGSRRADMVVPTSDRVYAFWYGLQGGKYGTLEVTSDTVFLSPQDIVLRQRRVESYRDVLRPLPTVGVHLSVPYEMMPAAMALEVLTQAGMRSIRRAELPLGTEVFHFESLPAEPLYVKLELPPWAYYEWVDLSAGDNRSVFFQPNPIHLTGTVYCGAKQHPASLTFRTNRLDHEDELHVETDAQGRYEVMLFRAGDYPVFIRLEGAELPAVLDHVQVPEKFEVLHDFHIPANRYRVKVADSKAGDGIAGAEVYADNSSTEGQPADSFKYFTNENGIAHLRPLRQGEVTVGARAKGYLPSDPLTEPVGDSPLEREIIIRLDPIGRTKRLRLLLSTGTAAVNADVRAQAALDNTLPFWEGRTDTSGFIEMPDYADGAFILIRHPEAGTKIRRWRTSEASGGDLEWSLAPPAPPLSIQVSRSWGDPVGASLALWLASRRVTGRTLAWLAGSPVGGTNRQGKWQAHNLPPVPISILAWTHSGTDRAQAGAYDSFAVTVPFPWLDLVEIHTAD
ncbi:MAG: carboxypeptidase regulatory-like domain-containing protein [bacterium]|nr:carboxypeptidase regulatory-like domain-containing protein [bacterium]